MATKKSQTGMQSAAQNIAKSTAADQLAKAIAGGNRAAAEVRALRARIGRKRRQAERRMAARQKAPRAAAAIPSRTSALLGPSVSAGTLIAEGDSWFDYPFNDVLRILEDEYLYDIESVAHKGDRVEDMAYSDGQFEEFARRLEKLLRDGKVPKAILLSGGGNDIAGEEFALLLNHAASSLPPLNDDIVRGVIDVRLRNAYARILSGLAAITRSYLNHPIPVVMHGYDYPIPDGRGFLGGWSVLPGPWLQPGFRAKGHGDLAENTRLIAALIDRFNVMLAEVSSHPAFAHVHYVDLRKTLSAPPYKKRWANELHPTASGFGLVTAKIAAVIHKL